MKPVEREVASSKAIFLVLMATRNGLPWVQQQLDSVLAQHHVNVRVRISDDASTDGTVQLLRSLAAHDQRIELLPQTAPSGSACANFLRLIRSVKSERRYTHIALCDQDDIWHPDKLSRALVCMEQSKADLYSAAVTAQWASGKTKNLLQNSIQTEADHLFEGGGQGCTFVLTRPLFDRVQAFAQHSADTLAPLHYHDWLIYALTKSWNRTWYYDPTPAMIYRQHGSNDTGARGSIAGILLRIQRISSSWYKKQVIAMLAACQKANPNNGVLIRATTLMAAAPKSLSGRLQWCAFLLKNSRRRLSERIVLALSAAFGRL